MAVFVNFPTSPSQTVLTIAGHDPSSGAGISADLQTFAAHGLFGLSAITALTVQSTLGVTGIHAIEPGFVKRVLEHLCADVILVGVKIGMVGCPEVVTIVAEFLGEMRVKVPVVYDPVLRSSSGASLFEAADLEALHRTLIPAVSWMTPNWMELSALAGAPVQTLPEAEAALHRLADRHPHLHLVATGGDHAQPVDLLRMPCGEMLRFAGEHIESTSTHGTGCAFSSSLLSGLVHGKTAQEAVRHAKEFTVEAIRRAPGVGRGRGPLGLLWPLRP